MRSISHHATATANTQIRTLLQGLTMKVQLLVLGLALLGVASGYWDELREARYLVRSRAHLVEKRFIKAGYTKVGRAVGEGLQQDATCDLCQTVAGALKTLAVEQNPSYSDIRELVVGICIELLTTNTTRGDIFCPGFMDLQVPHILTVLKSPKTNKENLCRNLNMCFVPKSSRAAPIDPLSTASLEYYPVNGRHPHLLRGRQRVKEALDSGFNAPSQFLRKPEEELDAGFNAPTHFLRSSEKSDAVKPYDGAPVPSQEGAEVDPGFNAPPGFLLQGIKVEQVKQASSQVDPQAEVEVEPMESTTAGDIKIIQISDAHYDPKYAIGSPTDCGLVVCCHDEFEGTGRAGEHGEFTCNIPQRTVEAMLREVQAMKPDFVLYSGDNPPHTIWQETRDSQFSCSRVMYKTMQNILSGLNVYPSMGNHENFPTNLYNPRQPDTQRLNSLLAELWAPLAKFDKAQQDTVKKGAYYTKLIKPGMRIININTNFWYIFNFYTTLNEMEPEFAEMETFISNTLKSARQNNEKVVIQYHHPPGTFDQMHTAMRRLTDVINQYTDIIFLQVAGHTHRDSFKIFSQNGRPSSMVYVEPTMTSKDGFYPSMRVYYLDATTLQIKDYEQYRYDILAAKPKLYYAYSARKDYNLKDLSPESWFELSNRLMTDVELRKKWLLNNHGGVERPCDEDCVIQRICDLRHTVFDDVLKCEDALREGGNPIADPYMYKVTSAASIKLPSLMMTILFGIVAALRTLL